MTEDKMSLKTMTEANAMAAKDAVIQRLNIECEASMDTIARERARAEKAEAQVERLRGLLKQTRCPAGGWTGQPADMEPTVENCMKHGSCGCDVGIALEQLGGEK